MLGFQRIYNNVLYFRKDHFCPNCGKKLDKSEVSKIINKESPEAKNFDFRIGGLKPVGDVKIVWDEFECPSCKKHYTVEEIMNAEGVKNKRLINPFTLFFIAVLLFFVLRFIKGI